MKEDYLRRGESDNGQTPIVGIALPASLVRNERQSLAFIFGYMTLLTMVVPCCIGVWWFRFRTTTTDGLHVTTAYQLFSAATYVGDTDYMDVIKILSECHEVVTAVQRFRRRLDTERLVQLCVELPTKRDFVISGSVAVCSLSDLTNQSQISLQKC